MSTLTNDLEFTLDNPCKREFLMRDCRDRDYRSWRKVAVALRSTMLRVDFSRAPQDFYLRCKGWLRAWVDEDAVAAYPVAKWVAIDKAWKQADPVLEYTPEVWGVKVPTTKTAARFPQDPPISFNLQTIYNYTPITMELVKYIREGWALVQEAEDEGWVEVFHSELERAEQRPHRSDWLPVVVAGGGFLVFLGAVAFAATKGAAIMRQIKRAR